MVTNDPEVHTFAVLVWALWRALVDLAQRHELDSGGSEDIQFFPDEVQVRRGRETCATRAPDARHYNICSV
jgi:hypothetical protein